MALHGRHMKVSTDEMTVLDYFLLSGSKPGAYITHNASWVTSLEAIDQIPFSFFWSHKTLYTSFSHTCSRSLKDPVNTLWWGELAELPFNNVPLGFLCESEAVNLERCSSSRITSLRLIQTRRVIQLCRDNMWPCCLHLFAGPNSPSPQFF